MRMHTSRLLGAWLASASVTLAAINCAARSINGSVGAARTLLHNRISPNYSDLYIANADGSDERLLLGDNAGFDFRAQWSADGAWIYFTSERRGNGQSDIYRVAINGTTITSEPELMVASDGVEDAAALSPDSKVLAYATTRYNQTSNIMMTILAIDEVTNLTLGGIASAADETEPNGYFKPTWTPDSEWILFSSDRNTPWRGHSDGAGWEHVQELSIYKARPNSSDFSLVSSRANYTQGSPHVSPDGKRVVFYEMLTEDTYNGRLQPELLYSGYLNSSIVSVDIETGTDRIVHASGYGTRISPKWVTNDVSLFVVLWLKTLHFTPFILISLSKINF